MISKNILAILIIIVITISFISTFLVLKDVTIEEGQETAAATAKVQVIELPKPPSSTGSAIVNVIEKPTGG
jgi:hypothetical protein